MLDLLNWYSSFLYSYLTFTSVFLFQHLRDFLDLKKYIYFWLCWVFVVVCRLSSCSEQGVRSSCGALLLLWSRGSRCRGFSSCGIVGSTVAMSGLQSMNSRVVARALLPLGRRLFLDQGSNGVPCICKANSKPLSHQGSLRFPWF